MAKVTFSDITTGFQSVGTINNNYTQLEYELQEKVLYRNNPSGEPNEMQNDLDMNGYRILNLGNSTALSSLSVVQSVIWGTQRNGTGTHSLSIGDVFRSVEVSITSSSTAVMFLTTEGAAGWTNGQWISILQVGVGKVKVQADTGVTIRSSFTGNLSQGQYKTLDLKYRGSDIWYLNGNS